MPVNKYQEEWYPEGREQSTKTFLKRSLRNHSFNPNRTFNFASDNPQDLLISRLYGQSNDLTYRDRTRKNASNLQEVVKDRTFHVIEASIDTHRDGGDHPGEV